MSLLPTNCTCCDSELIWDKTNTNLVCPNMECEGRLKSEAESFFSILEVEHVREGVIDQLFTYANCKSYRDILKLSKDSMLNCEGFQNKKANLVYNSIHNKLKGVQLSKIQHATNLFSGLGSKKLKLLETFNNKDNIPTKKQIVSIDGFSDISADIYLKGINKFWEILEELPVTIEKPVETIIEGDKCSKWVVCFTGVRCKETENVIVTNGGLISSGVSKKVNMLVCKDVNSSSSKVKKAKDLGIKVLSLSQLKEML